MASKEFIDSIVKPYEPPAKPVAPKPVAKASKAPKKVK